MCGLGFGWDCRSGGWVSPQHGMSRMLAQGRGQVMLPVPWVPHGHSASTTAHLALLTCYSSPSTGSCWAGSPGPRSEVGTGSGFWPGQMGAGQPRGSAHGVVLATCGQRCSAQQPLVYSPALQSQAIKEGKQLHRHSPEVDSCVNQLLLKFH